MINAMIYLIRHAWYGNDAPPWVTAATRALAGAFITGALSLLGIWSQTNDPKALAIAFLVPFLSTIGGRGVVEGAVDARKKRKGQQ